jgi:hydroxymethylglutaryl-CoA reductase
LLGCRGPNSAKKLAEIIAGACLAAEISLIGSMAADDFARAHAIFGRGKKKNKERLKDENA